MIVSYYTKNELEAAKTVSDKELNELLQEIRKKDDRYYLIEKKYTIKNGWVKSSIEERIGYTLLFNTHACECQIVNFCQDHDQSINTTVSKSYIHVLFCGWLNGYKCKQEAKVETPQTLNPYILLKDLPGIKAGTILPNRNGEIYFKLPNADYEQFYMESYVKQHPDFFKEMVEPKKLFDINDMEDAYHGPTIHGQFSDYIKYSFPQHVDQLKHLK